MLEHILDIERDAFLWLNGGHTPFWDSFMWLYSGKAVWIPVSALILFMLFYRKNPKESLLILLFLALAITLCDQFASGVCKPLFMRLRPTQHPDFMDAVQTVYNYRGGKYGFISSHAANAFGFAVFTLLLLRDGRYTAGILLWAVMMCYSRIYLGVHFISDIVPGMIAGALFGFLCYKLYSFVRAKGFKRAGSASGMFPAIQKRLILCGLLTTVCYMLIYSHINVNILHNARAGTPNREYAVKHYCRIWMQKSFFSTENFAGSKLMRTFEARIQEI
ncbi:MAG: phosphatase PAP2 family protein [Tannerella sp.]|jgi:undecaprenyl-diphosphatase|nr:phosphatase PAP2 family protein [Tannerella sp.]